MIISITRVFALGVFTAVIGSVAGCGGGGANVSSNTETLAKVEKAVAAAPTRSLLVGLETKAFDAWKNNDYAFWNSHFDANFVTFINGRRYDKAGEITLISDGKCEISSYALSDEKMTPVGNDAIVLTMLLRADGKCYGQKFPDTATIASLYIRSGDTWKSAYHNEVVVLDPKTPRAAAPKTAEAKPENKTAEPQKSDAFTAELFAIETKVWDAWKTRDRAAMEQQLSQDLTLIDSTGAVTVGKKAVVDAWILPKCDIKSATPSEGVATQISPVVGILTFKGNATGPCEGQPLENFWGTSIFLKEAGEWKIVYTVETPV